MMQYIGSFAISFASMCYQVGNSFAMPVETVLIHEDTSCAYSLVLFVCAVLAVGPGRVISIPTDMDNTPSVQDRGAHTGGDF
jgi:hypothetical protein